MTRLTWRGAINVPLKELDREAVSDLDNDGAVIFYCHDYL